MVSRGQIYANYKTIVDNVNFNDIQDYLYSNADEFTTEDLELVQSKPTRYSQMRELLNILLEVKRPEILALFCLSLKNSEVKPYKMLAEAIENTDISLHYDNIDASYERKITKMKEKCIEQTKILKDDSTPLTNIPEFKQLSRDGEFILNKDIEEFSKYNFKGVNLVFKKDKILNNVKEVACQLGEDAFSTSSSTNKYNVAMRKLVTDVRQKNNEELKDIIKNMHILEIVGYPTVEAIARELYDECNWGRIVVWFAFWKELADCLEGRPEEFKTFGNYVGSYLASTCEKWILKNGGWDHILEMASQCNANSPNIIRRFLIWLGIGREISEAL